MTPQQEHLRGRLGSRDTGRVPVPGAAAGERRGPPGDGEGYPCVH